MNPKLSIITVNLNNATGLLQTIESTLGQTFNDYEFILIDGMSKDGSIDIIKQFSNRFSYWCSEPDSSIYDAMNKGIRKAQGEYCLFMNSGDTFASPTVLDDLFRDHPTEDLIYGDLILNIPMSLGGISLTRRKLKKSIPTNKLFIEHFVEGTIPHQACLIRTRSLHQQSGYRTNLSIASDWAFFLEAIYIHHATFRHVPIPVCNFSMSGVSTNPKNWQKMREERIVVWKHLFPNSYKDIFRLAQYSEAWNIVGVKLLFRLFRAYRTFRQTLTRLRRSQLS